MVKIPLILKLKKESHKNIARAQDLIVEEVYRVFNKAVLHGGTAIWRCYNGNRFSEDVDFYISRNLKKINLIFKNLEKKGFILERKKIGKNSLYSNLRFNRTLVRFEALFRDIKGELKEYETIDGNLITIYTLLPEELINEKMNAYLERKKIRDLYDIFFLLRHLKEQNKRKVKDDLSKFADNFIKPIDEKELKVLIIRGVVPDTEEMVSYIKREI